MAVNVGGIILDTSVLDKITDEIRPKAHKVIGQFGFVIVGDAAVMAPYITGALHDSILSESGFVADLTWRVQDGVTYGVFQELGTSKMAAHPFIVPAIEKWREKFCAAFSELFKT